MDLQLAGRTVLITGASKGIGLECAAVFAREGCRVVMVARDAARLAEAAKSLALPQEPVLVAADLSLGEERERLFAAHSGIDILVNNAGAIPGGSLLDLSMERWEEAWALKVMGYIHLTKLYLPAMYDRRAGTILNIIGTGGRMPRYDYVCGGAGNAALMAFTSAVGARSVDQGVRVVGLNPGITRTERSVSVAKARAASTLGSADQWQKMFADLPLGRPAEPAEIANTAAFLCSPACGYVSGTVLDVDGGTVNR